MPSFERPLERISWTYYDLCFYLISTHHCVHRIFIMYINLNIQPRICHGILIPHYIELCLQSLWFLYHINISQHIFTPKHGRAFFLHICSQRLQNRPQGAYFLPIILCGSIMTYSILQCCSLFKYLQQGGRYFRKFPTTPVQNSLPTEHTIYW